MLIDYGFEQSRLTRSTRNRSTWVLNRKRCPRQDNTRASGQWSETGERKRCQDLARCHSRGPCMIIKQLRKRTNSQSFTVRKSNDIGARTNGGAETAQVGLSLDRTTTTRESVCVCFVCDCVWQIGMDREIQLHHHWYDLVECTTSPTAALH